ncbi:hypothetical protein LMG28727_04862 [Paraburkholderia kirstenboschensis]|uniref:hypothetical protein n=1 Tax=Paraburkholderia kirstenboschensis TaxID=1245436 RepID=UPI000AFE71E6|nr:hypothetical protein [Paraburkholderia kirstenboschensis]CAD6548611.1 hypothetical protein LMG28727_04862 [Paraburkholderia kirstenboschensis]
MPIDPSIALNANRPAPVNPLQQALSVAQFRYMNSNGQALQQQLDSNRATSEAYQQATDPTTGAVDNNKLVGILSQDPRAAYNLPQVMQGIQNLKQANQTYQTGQVKLSSDQIDNAAKMNTMIYQRLSTLDPNDPKFSAKVMQNGVDLINQFHADPAMVMSHLQGIPQDPAGRQAWLQRGLASVSGTLENLKAMTPNPTQVDTGGSLTYVDTNPLTNPSIVGSTINKTLDPVTASSPVSVNGPNNQPGIVPRGELWNVPPLPNGPNPAGAGATAPMPGGPQPGGAAPTQAGRGHFVATAPAMGVQGSNDGNVQTVNTHWTALSNDASNAQTNIGLAQNIKAYADKALTGKQGDKLAAVNGLLSIFGQGAQSDLNTATDLLQKNMARLSLTSRQSAGGTDAAGALATAANPHGTMTADAIKDAADQVIGAQQMALSEQKVLQPYKLNNNVAGYQQAQTQFNQAADPRIWQFANMNAQQRANFKANMSPADQKAFASKIRILEGMGAIQ